MRISVGFLFDGAVQALEVLFDQKLCAGLRSGPDANPVAVDPSSHLVHRDSHHAWRALQKIDKRAARLELNEGFHGPAIANPSDFFLREP